MLLEQITLETEVPTQLTQNKVNFFVRIGTYSCRIKKCRRTIQDNEVILQVSSSTPESETLKPSGEIPLWDNKLKKMVTNINAQIKLEN